MMQLLACLTLIFLLLPPVAFAKNPIEDPMRKCPGSDEKCPQVIDQNLKECIAREAGKPFDALSNEDFLKITSLSCPNSGITDLTGIESLSFLAELDLVNNHLTDISPLTANRNLTKLYLVENRITDISPVGQLKQLTELYLWDNRLDDISPLKNLSQLEELLLGDNQIRDISPLNGLGKLIWLELYNNKIQDISPLGDLVKLTYLDVSGNNVSELNPMGKLRGLTRLYLHDNNIDDITPLADLQSIDILFLGSNRITDILALAGLKNLRILNLDNNLISDISPLENTPKLQLISILNNCIRNIEAIRQKIPVFDDSIIYQRLPCQNNESERKAISEEWIDAMMKEQCVELGDNEYTNKYDYKYFSDGIYYYLYSKKASKQFACRLPWNSDTDLILDNLEYLGDPEGSYQLIKFGTNHLYSVNGKIKGFSSADMNKSQGTYEVLKEIEEIFQAAYDLKKTGNKGRTILTAKGDGHYIRIIDNGETYSLEFFEPEFFEQVLTINKSD